MDPNAALATLVNALEQSKWDVAHDALMALNDWHAAGGFLPTPPKYAPRDVEPGFAFMLGRLQMAADACDRERYADAMVTLAQEIARAR